MEAVTPKEKSDKFFEKDRENPKFPESPLVLDDSKLLDYRYPAERQTLLLALATVGVLIVGGFFFREKDIMLAAAVVYLSMVFASIQAKTFYSLQGAEVTPTQFPAIYKIVEELRMRFRPPPTRVFVLQTFSIRAETMGLVAPYVIVLPSVVIDDKEPDELRYILGQAFGHICFGHTRVTILMGGEQSALPAVLSWVASLRDLIFAAYWRAANMSADRAGVLACGSVAQAIRAQVKLSVGAKQVDEVRISDLLEQSHKVSHGLTRVQAVFVRWRSPVPPLVPRLEAMIAWAGYPHRSSDESR